MTEKQKSSLRIMMILSMGVLLIVLVAFILSMIFMHNKINENIYKRFETNVQNNILTASVYDSDGIDTAELVAEAALTYSTDNKEGLFEMLSAAAKSANKFNLENEVVAIAYADGTVLYSNGTMKTDVNVFKNSYETYNKTKSSELTVIKNSPFSGKDCVTFLKPIVATDGSVIAMVSVENTLDDVLELFKHLEVDGVVLMNIYDNDGNVILGYENENDSNKKTLELLSEERKDPKLFLNKISDSIELVDAKKGSNYLAFCKNIFNDNYKVLVLVNQEVYGTQEYQIANYTRTVFIIAFIGMCMFFLMTILTQRAKMNHMKNTIYYNTETGLSTMERAIDMYGKLKNKGKGYTIATLRSNDFGLFNELFGFEVVDQIIADVSTTILKSIDDKRELGLKSQGKASFVVLLKNSEGDTTERLSKILSDINSAPITDGDIRYSINPHFTLTTYEITGQERDFFQVLNNLELNTTMGINDTKDSESALAGIIDDIPEAFEKNQFVPIFEIRKDIFTDEVVGADLSVYWDHPKLGKIKEEDFMRLLEVKRSSLRLELYMVEQACKLIKKWTDNKMMPLPITLKIVNGNIYNTDFINRLENIVNEYKVAPALIELSIHTPRNKAVHERFARKVVELKARGFSISMPDFYGAVYSETILQIPYNSICVNFTTFYAQKTRETGLDVLLFAKNICRRCGFDLHVQGVDNEDLLKFLKDNDIHYAQGSLIEPMTTLKEYESLVFDGEDLINQEIAEKEKAKLDEAAKAAAEEAAVNGGGFDDKRPERIPDLP